MNKPTPIFLKLFIWHIIIILTLSITIFLVTFYSLKSHYINTLENSLRNLSTALNLKFLSLYKNNQIEELNKLVRNFSRESNIRITIVNNEGTVLIDSAENPKMMENHKNRPEINRALQGYYGRSIRYSSTVRKEMLYIAVPMINNKKIIGVLRLSLFIDNINLLLNDLRKKMLYIIFIIMFVSLLIALLFSKIISKPVKELYIASNKIAKGDFDVRINIKSNDEFSNLADSFNYMTQEIKSLFSDITQKKEELSKIISSIREGLVIINKEDRIILSNESFNKIFGLENITGKYYWETIREPSIINLLKKAAENRKEVVSEIEYNGRIYIASVTEIGLTNEFILTLSDITEIRKIESIKKEFISNLSHELKTPLTSIKGFIETLEEEVRNEKHKNHLNIVKRNLERLINIVNDMMLLSKFEEKGFKLELEKVNLKSILENILKIFEHKIKENKLKFTVDIETNLPEIVADPFKIEQMLVNLIDNAIKYSEKEDEIRISMTRVDSVIKINIEDTGIGIPKEHLPHIFERFYVVDKSRSRKLGGTGLGLSIVKHIVLHHNGSINVESEPGKGTKFTIHLPINPI